MDTTRATLPKMARRRRQPAAVKPAAVKLAAVKLAALVLLVMLPSSAWAASPPDAAAAAPQATETALPGIRVVSRQAVTIDGTFPSLRDVVEQLCRESGVTLRSYTAPDRAVQAHYTEIPLREALQRLLFEESFVFGVRKKPGAPRAKLTWLRVSASNGDSGSRRTGANTAVVLPRSGLVSAQPAARRRAVQTFAQRLQDDRDLRDRFLRTPDATLLTQLGRQPYALEFLAALGQQTRVPAVRSKVSRLRVRLSRAR